MGSKARGDLCSYMETVRKSLQIRGFLIRIAGLVSRTKHCSTESIYQYHWCAGVCWATERGFDPLSPTVNDLAEYFFALGPRKET